MSELLDLRGSVRPGRPAGAGHARPAGAGGGLARILRTTSPPGFRPGGWPRTPIVHGRRGRGSAAPGLDPPSGDGGEDSRASVDGQSAAAA